MAIKRSIVVLLLCFLACPGGAFAGDSLVVIVHSKRIDDLHPAELAQIYLKKRRFWSDGEPIVAVNRQAESDVRAAFTHRVFEDQARRLGAYWNRQYFHGVLPPATLASDEAVKQFVALEPNAVGYIRADLVDESVRVVLTLEIP